MKKLIIAICALALPAVMSAQSEGLFARKKINSAKADQSAYAKKGIIPMVNGKVEYGYSIAAPGKSKEEIFQNLSQWASFRYEPNTTQGVYTDANFFKNIEYSRVKSADKASGEILCDGAEELIFSLKPLAKNYTQAFYVLKLKATDGKVEFRLCSLSFNVDMGEGQFSRQSAEELITDEEALNKKGELRRFNGKFRIKTIDLVDELTKEIGLAINK